MGNTTQRKTCTVEDAAKILGIGRRAAYAGVNEGSIPSLRIGRRILVPIAKLNALLEDDAEETA